MAEAYLEKPTQELKDAGWGTTNIAYISNNKSGTIYVGVDSRSTNKGFIKTDNAYKYLHMESCNVFATRTGKVCNSKKMLAHVDQHFSDHGGIVNGISEASKKAYEFIHSWETKRKLEFPASTIMSGWKVGRRGVGKVPYVCKVTHSGVEVKTKSKRCTGFVNGSGGLHAGKYLDSCNLKVTNSNELLQHVTRALLYAALFDECSGGYVRVFEVLKQGGFEKVYDQPVMRALLDHYDALASYLSKSLFFIFYELDYKYTHDINVKVHEGFRRQFEGEYIKNVVINQGPTYIIRLVHFKNPIDELYEKLKRKNSQRVVPPKVGHLPSVQIEEIGEAPILCGKITEELVENLQDI
ncbi:hypothetical protein ACE6H2_022084 [Prunus campanulata]